MKNERIMNGTKYYNRFGYEIGKVKGFDRKEGFSGVYKGNFKCGKRKLVH